MSTIIDFFLQKGGFGRKFIVQHGIYLAPFVTVLSLGRLLFTTKPAFTYNLTAKHGPSQSKAAASALGK